MLGKKENALVFRQSTNAVACRHKKEGEKNGSRPRQGGYLMAPGVSWEVHEAVLLVCKVTAGILLGWVRGKG